MAKLRRLPAEMCEFYISGRCLLEERKNPGYHAAWRCILLSRLEREYDKLLSQADAFSLEQETAVRIWSGRMRGLVPEYVCADYQPGGSDVTGCGWSLGGVCVRKLPECPGTCRKFRATGGRKD